MAVSVPCASGGGQYLTIDFLPQQPCGFPACDTVQLIQVVRVTGFDDADQPHYPTENDQAAYLFGKFPEAKTWIDSLDAWTTALHWHIDLPLNAGRVPYYTQPEATRGQSYPGSTGSSPRAARITDVARRRDPAFPAGLVKLRVDFEINAFCAAGDGRGQYLGRATWQWERIKGVGPWTGTVTAGPTGTTSQPSQEFLDAVQRYVDRTHFQTPVLGGQ